MRKLTIVIYLFFISICALGSSCDVWSKLASPEVAQNEKFWEDFKSLKDPSRADEIARLLKKHELLDRPQNHLGTIEQVTTKVSFNYHHKAQKALNKLPMEIRKHLEDFVHVVEQQGMHTLYNQPGRWHFEKIKHSSTRTVRLNSGYRVEFSLSEDGRRVEVLDIGKHVTH